MIFSKRFKHFKKKAERGGGGSSLPNAILTFKIVITVYALINKLFRMIILIILIIILMQVY